MVSTYVCMCMLNKSYLRLHHERRGGGLWKAESVSLQDNLSAVDKKGYQG